MMIILKNISGLVLCASAVLFAIGCQPQPSSPSSGQRDSSRLGQAVLGYRGHGPLGKDTAEAVRILDSLALVGNAHALRERGRVEESRGNAPQALSYYRQAIAVGDTISYAWAAYIHSRGLHGHPQRLDSFVVLMTRAEKAGVRSAHRMLERFYSDVSLGVQAGDTTARRIERELKAQGLWQQSSP